LTTYKKFGPPGTGKTTRLLAEVTDRLESGVNPLRIAYLAFTKKAASEARGRAVKLLGLSESDQKEQLFYFRTLHSLCYQLLSISDKKVITEADYKKFGKRVNLNFEVSIDEERRTKTNNPIISLLSLYRLKMSTLREEYNKTDFNYAWNEVDFIDRSYQEFKKTFRLIDYTDMLTEFESIMHLVLPKTFSLICIDESQDLSPLQWKIVANLKNHTEDLILAGDDDQAIYGFTGASPEEFLHFEGEAEVLNQSYRTPKSIYRLISGIINTIPSNKRQQKTYQPKEEEGSVRRINSLQELDFSSGEWLILAQANYMLDTVAEDLKSAGYLFMRNGGRSISYNLTTAIITWERLRKGKEVSAANVQIMYKYMTGNGGKVQRGFKKLNVSEELFLTYDQLVSDYGLLASVDEIWSEALDSKTITVDKTYVTSILRKGDDSFHLKTPRIQLSTIHGAKGGEAQNVVVFLDLTTAAIKNNENYENHRVFYVACSRPTENLYLVEPQDYNRSFVI
tara:strand:+ start:3236 stop:4762 length:1527 start_codon:yes stop_codon:yes gene_type:complete